MRGIVLVGDVVGSRRDLAGSSTWTRLVSRELAATYGPAQLAPFDHAQGDEVQGLLSIDADPFRAVLLASLHEARLPMRWAVVAGTIEAGEGSATQRTGEAFVAARALIAAAKSRHDGLLVATGARRVDALLDNLAPVLAASFEAMTARQRTIARLMLLDGWRQADVATHLDISRATVSVAHARGRLRDTGRLLEAIRSIFRDGVTQGSEE